ncbi:DUF4328 domain-containing protein [Streptomyces sp. NPDC001508]|uniref:DUF4328 domain-containing protein n=1 Tax=Streptomyces sp. NPDC001508 TaxID=3154656 RepID=UPI0033275198
MYGAVSAYLGPHGPDSDVVEEKYATVLTTQELHAAVARALVAVWLVWLRRAHMDAALFAPGSRRYGSGIVAGSCITVGQLWIPFQMAKDIWAVSGFPAVASGRRTVLDWWRHLDAAMFGAMTLSFFSGALSDSPEDFRSATARAIFVDLMSLARGGADDGDGSTARRRAGAATGASRLGAARPGR